MGQVLDELRAWNCDVEGAMNRFINDEDLYVMCLGTLLADNNFEDLGTNLKEKNVEKAFDNAHSLKGVLANLGLTPMYDVVVQIVEPLRAGNCENLEGFYDELLLDKAKLAALL